MGNTFRTTRTKWLLPAILALASVVFTGCDKGSLGVKNGVITGYVLEDSKNVGIADVLIRIEAAATHKKVDAMTGGDGQYSFGDLTPGDYTVDAEKFGYTLATVGSQTNRYGVRIEQGETVTVPVFRMTKTSQSVKGTLKGYPVDNITGMPLNGFTITQMDPARSKTFESADDFRTAGWQGLEGGFHQYKINAENYQPYLTQLAAGGGGTTTGSNSAPLVTISGSAFDMGVIRLVPEVVSITGIIRNLPGYVIEAAGGGFGGTDFLVWAESGGKVVAQVNPTVSKGVANYTLANVPVTVGSVVVKCKLRGYDTVTINTSVSLPRQRPGTAIGNIDVDFSNIEPVRRDLRVVLIGSKPDPSAGTPSSVADGDVLRVYLKQGGAEVVPYVDCVGHNFSAEAFFSGVPAGYSFDIVGVNLTLGYHKIEEKGVIILENGNSVQTITTEVK